MNIEVNERRENALLEREEIRLSVDHTGEATPSENALRKQLAAELDLDPLTVQVDHIYSPSGAAVSTAQVTVFEEPIMDELPEDEDDGAEGAAAAEGEADAAEGDEADEEEDAADAEADVDEDDEEAEETDDEEEEDAEDNAEDEEEPGADD